MIHFLHKVQLHKLTVIQSPLNLVLSNGIQNKVRHCTISRIVAIRSLAKQKPYKSPCRYGNRHK